MGFLKHEKPNAKVIEERVAAAPAAVVTPDVQPLNADFFTLERMRAQNCAKTRKKLKG